MNFIEVFKLIVSILPMLIEAIKTVEAAVPGQGNGEQKLAVVRSVLESSYEVAGNINFESVWDSIRKVVNALVSVFNKTGVFMSK
jgi:hypothetical protein